MRRLLVALAVLLAACIPGVSTQANPPASTAAAIPTAAASRTAEPTGDTSEPTGATPSAARCVRNGTTALAGVVEARPVGWSSQTAVPALAGFPNTSGQVYGSAGAAVSPYEGPGRLVLYETLPANGTYLKSRSDQSRNRGGKPVAVTVCAEATEVWLDDSTGELILGWTDRDKSDVLVANSADFTVKELVVAAESVYDCCG